MSAGECNALQHSFKSSCSQDLEEINNLPEDDKLTFLSDLGKIHLTKKFYICTNHILELKNRKHNRLRVTYCQIAECLSSHKGVQRKSDRHLTFPTVQKIYENYGSVIPVGTAICKNCRAALLATPESNRAGCSTSDDEGNSYIHRRDSNQHAPAKRARMDVSTSVYISEAEESTHLENDSQTSVASGFNVMQLDALNQFLYVAGMSPVKELQESILTASKSTQYRYIEKAKKCVDLVFQTMCPNAGEFLKSNLLKETESDDTTLKNLVEIYKAADTWKLQRQVLSIIATEYSHEDVQKLIPGITRYKFTKARKHATVTGIGKPVEKKQQQRVKYEDEQIEHFVDFITSDHIIKDLPYGEKTLKLSSGEITHIPLVIRSLAPATIITQYTELCKEEDVKPLGKSTMFKVLDECSALVRKSIEGLDNFVMEGSRAFGELEVVLDQLSNQGVEVGIMKEGLKDGKRYLKSEYKSHVVRESEVADHCLSFALSSNIESCFKESCQHLHNKSCEDCDNLENVLTSIKENIGSSNIGNKEAVMYTVEESVTAILRWKAHIVRSKCQEEAKSSLVNAMAEEEVVITCDWAMKFLPRKYREGMVDWFAKRGINWHIAISLLKESNTFLTITHIDIFEEPVPQDKAITSQILVDLYRDIKTQYPKIKKFHFISDNAGCYNSTDTLVRIHSEMGTDLVSYDFSEAQNGKGPCDRRASHIKGIIRRYINQGHDVVSAQQMKQAIDQGVKKDKKVKIVGAVTIVDIEKCTVKKPIPMVSQLYNFEYHADNLVSYKAYKVGKGKVLPWDKIDCPVSNLELSTICDWENGELSRLSIQEDSNNRDDSGHPVKKQQIFECPKEDCLRTFKTVKLLDEHVTLGDCTYRPSKFCLKDKAKNLYSEKLLSLFPSKQIRTSSEKSVYLNSTRAMQMGWALKVSKTRTNFTDRQLSYMLDKYNQGKFTGRKVDPYVAAAEMRGNGEFKREEFLSGQQIGSHFSRLCQRDRKTSSEDYEAAKFEENKETLKQKIANLLD